MTTLSVNRLKKALRHPLLHACLLVFAAAFTYMLFLYAASLPIGLRERGDAVEYLGIAGGFKTFSGAFSYTGNRTYGYPLFLFIIKTVFSPATVNEWVMETAVVQFCFHILCCLVFYAFFLRRLFAKAGLSSLAATTAGALLIAWPPLATYAAIPITDTFSADILMLAIAAFHLAQDLPLRRAIPLLLLCGLLCGYSIMIRPAFLPAALVFTIGNFLVAGKNRTAWIKAFLIALGLLIVVAPEVKNVHDAKGVYALQDPAFLKKASEQFWGEGPSAVQIWYPSDNRPLTVDIPSVHDPYLEKTYSACIVHSWPDLAHCLLSHPAALPFFLVKKAVALFNAWPIEVYASNQTPDWYRYLQRAFGIAGFCGFISLSLMFLARPFSPFVWIGLPWMLSMLALYGIYAPLSIEGRFGFSLTPLSLAALFLGGAAAAQSGKRVFRGWLALMAFAALVFVYQAMAWDAIPPL